MGCSGEANIRPCDSNINRVSSKALCLIASGLLGAETDHAMSLCEKLISYSVVGHGWSGFGASAVRVIWPKAGDLWIGQACWAPNGTVTHEWLAACSTFGTGSQFTRPFQFCKWRTVARNPERFPNLLRTECLNLRFFHLKTFACG